MTRLALLDTSARPDTRRADRAAAWDDRARRGGRFSEMPDLLFPVFVHRNRQGDEALRAMVRTMAEETGPEAFMRQQRAIMTRPDCAPAALVCPLPDARTGG